MRVWSKGHVNADSILDFVRAIDGVALALDKSRACQMFDMPPEREADVVVVSREDVCIGASATGHDLEGLRGYRLRTHGGLSEAKVPLILNRPLNAAYRHKVASQVLKSYHAFEFALNGTD